ncbi:MAG: hypothetical protein A2Z25_23820 [Planctomycetes bacterium RBG_16_55_9]|nr:MAG: hypothetical protein A2Z25_23820 [Planctomycetes bacterium RBG_16_55_9]
MRNVWNILGKQKSSKNRGDSLPLPILLPFKNVLNIYKILSVDYGKFYKILLLDTTVHSSSGLGWISPSGDPSLGLTDSSDSSDCGSEDIRYSESSQAPKSISLHRSLQKGKNGDCSMGSLPGILMIL